MNTVAIQLENLSKTFGRGKKRIEAVKNVSLSMAEGQVYGLLGPNGAGKTTAMRLMLDLMTPTTGAAYVFGQDVRQNHDVLRRVGALIEGAAFYPYLSGQKNLEVIARTHGCYDKARIQALLEQVGLADRARQRFSRYSMGMKQRLGLAATLLHDPDLFILDEPTNGLDPAGIQEMRTFIRDLVDKEGKTVCLSSHMLNEVEQICDRVAIINKGEIIREGTVKALLEVQSRVRVRATPQEKAAAILGEHWPVSVNGVNGQAGLMVETPPEDVPHIVRKLVEHSIEVYEVTHQKQSLEEFFLSVTQERIAPDGGQHVQL